MKCKDCKWLISYRTVSLCGRDDGHNRTDYVRSNGKLCGSKAKWFSKKPWWKRLLGI